jgi:hypothetical protein
MGKHKVTASFKNKKGKLNIDVPLFSFQEGKVIIVYSPHLDLSAYGDTEKEAFKAFTEAMALFFDYTTNKGTLVKELTRLGWKIKKKKYQVPDFDTLLRDNEHFKEILSGKDYHKVTKKIEIPELV